MSADRVLIVDDDIQTLRLVGLMLERQGFTILAANSGSQGLQMAKTEHPDIIILDVMMPDLDGYAVARLVRQDPQTKHLPILMFTAKSQVEDKVAGYDAGIDDYLTKPIHPAELNARLRALLSRSKAQIAARERGYIIGVTAAKGGVGVSSLALNLAVMYQQCAKTSVIAAEMRPGQSSWRIELGYQHTAADGLCSLLRCQPSAITEAAVESQLNRLPCGVRLLLSSTCTADSQLMHNTRQIEAVVDILPLLAKLTLLDIGTSFTPGFGTLVSRCDEIMIAAEPNPTCLRRTRELIETLSDACPGRAKFISVVIINRTRSEHQPSLIQMQEILGLPVSQVIPPAPELINLASNQSIPMVQMQPGSALNFQYLNLAERLAQRVPA